MADSKISNLTGAAALTGTEEVPVVQGGVTVKTTAQDIADLSSGGTDTNLGNSDQEINSTGERKIVLGGSTSTDTLTVYDETESDKLLNIQGDGVVQTNALYTEIKSNTPVNGVLRVRSSQANSGIEYWYNNAGTLICELRESVGGVLWNLRNGSGTTTVQLNGGGNPEGLYLYDNKSIKFGASTGGKIGTATTQKIGFWNTTPVIQPTALTSQLTDITGDTTPTTPDYVMTATNGGWGCGSQDEFETLMSVIANLQARVQELEDKLSASAGGCGIIA